MVIRVFHVGNTGARRRGGDAYSRCIERRSARSPHVVVINVGKAFWQM
jgi:hypothetical protein